jgi:broad specificity phosphatase PhoE
LRADQWRLSPKGKELCEPLAKKLSVYAPVVIFSSPEAKAIETAECIAAQFDDPIVIRSGLEEHHRRKVGFLSEDKFRQLVADFFAHPGELRFGEETAEQAHNRFAQAIDEILSAAKSNNIIVVSHGSVISLFVGRRNGLDPHVLWRQLELPSFVILTVPAFRLISTN